MQEALENGDNERFDPSTFEPGPLISWPSGINEIDEVSRFYGMVTIGAARGTGKTLLSIGSAIEAASSGWDVCYFAAEDDRDGLATRFNNYVNAHPRCESAIDHFFLFQAGRGQSPRTITSDISGAVDQESDRPILTVIDSVNSLVEMSHMAYLDGLAQFGLWAMLARRYSGGQAAFLLVSETNRVGSVRGEKLPYLSDQVLIMQRGEGDVVELDLQKSRRTAGVGNLGRFVRIWNQGEFMSEREIEDLRRESFRVVDGGKLSTPEVAKNGSLEF